MERTTWRSMLLFFLYFLHIFSVASAATYRVKIGSDAINEVDKNFLSFTVDPKHLFSSFDMLNNEECLCMASFLSPAYLHIAGPSTTHVVFENTTLVLDNIEEPQSEESLSILSKHKKYQTKTGFHIIDKQWMEFVKWANNTGFSLVFALNNEEKSASGLWDPNSTLTLLSMAEKAQIENVVWQLGYECKNQSIDEYLNDLETLRLIIETVTSRQQLGWRLVGGDVTGCLGESKSDFKDYVSLTAGMTDALMLNGNSSYHELGRLSENDRFEILQVLYSSRTSLWLTEAPQETRNELTRAADWLSSLGYSARNGFHVHYRELMKEELFEPSLSFYMSLLFKNLVGERVLPVDNIPGEAATALFAHCTSLRHQPVPGAITLYGVNMDDEPARISLKLSNRQRGGEIMQFILKQDSEGNIILNGREMTNDGDMRPMLKRVRPYKTLIINLPAKSFGFWVLANTNIKVCHGVRKEIKSLVDAETQIDNTRERTKRFVKNKNINDDLHNVYLMEELDNNINVENERIEKVNKEIINFNSLYNIKNGNKVKRDTFEPLRGTWKMRRQPFNSKKGLNTTATGKRPLLEFFSRILQKQILRNKQRLNKKERPKVIDEGMILRNRRSTQEGKAASLTSVKEALFAANIVDVDNDTKNFKEIINISRNSNQHSDLHNIYNFEIPDEINEKDSAESITVKLKSLLDKRVFKDIIKGLKFIEKRIL